MAMKRWNRSMPLLLLAALLLCVFVFTYIGFSDESPYQNGFQTVYSNGLYPINSDKFSLEDNITTNQQMRNDVYNWSAKGSTKKSMFMPDDLEERFRRRRRILHEACLKYEDRFKYPTCEIELAGKHFKYVNESDMVYCAIEKSGSTFWKRILHVIGGWGNSTNPVAIKSKDANNKHGGFEKLENFTIEEIQEIVNNSNSFVFVRDPYTKLFSGWLDKFYSPNHFYWTKDGPGIVKTERLSYMNLTENPVTCVSDISFEEFISFIIKEIYSKSCVDMHFAPNYHHCLPCKIPLDYIGKYETFKEDTLYLLEKLNQSNKVTFNDFEEDAVWDAIRDSADWVFSEKEKIESCNVTFHCALFKLWNRMQSRGIISKKIDFPFKTFEEVQNITTEEFTAVLIKANRESDPDATKNNRIEAMQQAYKRLPVELQKRFIKTFEIDFALFEYDSHPYFLTSVDRIDFDYFKECQQ